MRKKKICSTCHEEKELSKDFYCYNNVTWKDCKACVIKRNSHKRKVWIKESDNHERHNRYMKKYYSANREKFAEYRKTFKERHPGYFREYHSKYKQNRAGKKPAQNN